MDFDEGEEWKALSEDFAYSNYGSLDNLRIYSRSKNLAIDVLRWALSIDEKHQSPEIDDFVEETLKIGAKLEELGSLRLICSIFNCEKSICASGHSWFFPA